MISKELLREVLTATEGNREEAAKILGIKRSTVTVYMSMHGLMLEFSKCKSKTLRREAGIKKRLDSYKEKVQA